MNHVTKEALEFLEEAKGMFENEPRYATYRDDDSQFIALRMGKSIMIYELGNAIGKFTDQLTNEEE